MRCHNQTVLFGFILSAPLVVAVLAQEPAPPQYYDRVVFASREGAGYIHRVSEDGRTLSFGATMTGGPTRRISIIPPAGQKVKVVLEAEQARITFEPPPSPLLPTPTPLPTPVPTPTPTATPTPGPTPTATPTSTPKPEPSHSPGTCVLGQSCQPPQGRYSQVCELVNGAPTCVDPKWRPLSCASLPDDPVGLERSGPGCDATGGNGTGVITVTALGPDGTPPAPGTLRWAYKQISASKRRIVCDPNLQGEIILETPLYWQKPRTTLDFSACDVTLRPVARGKPTLTVQASHNNIFYSVRSVGWFQLPHIEGQNRGMIGMDGDTTPVKWPWDDLWDTTPPLFRRTVHHSILDRITTTRCEDDCQALWMGVQDVTVSRFLIQGYHPTTMGAAPRPMPWPQHMQRLRDAYMYGVWYDSGERQTIPRRGTSLWVYARNLVYNWAWYKASQPPGGRTEAIGLQITDDGADENDLGYVLGACFIPGPLSKHPQFGNHNIFGCVIGNHAYCEDPSCPGGSGSRDIACCNPKMKKTRWYFEAAEGQTGDCQTNPPGYVPPPLPFPVDRTRPWSKVLAEAGVVKRNAAEQAKIDEIATRLPCMPR